MDLEHELDKTLAKIGLTKREQEVFSALAENGPSTLKSLILKTKLKKPTVYRVVFDLEQKGLVFSDNKKYEKTYTVHEPKRILSLLGNERRKLRRLELEFEEMLPQISTLFRTTGSQPKIEIYQHEEGYTRLANQTLECEEKIIYYLGNVENIYTALGNDYDKTYYIPTRLKRGIAFKMLTRKTPLTIEDYRKADTRENRETRFLPKAMQLETTILIFDDTVTFLSEPNEMLALAITSPSIAKTMKLVFQDLWEHAE